MNDRKLLEMAAKTAGYSVDCAFSDSPLIFGEDAGPDGPREWNPLEDDGDALRLAVKLELMIHISRSYITIYGDFPDQDFLVDECPRRAIVRAAAEIGRAMP